MTQHASPSLKAVVVNAVTPTIVGQGCERRDLPCPKQVRTWVVDIAPGCEWPYVDTHGAQGEQLYVVSGELIEGDRRFGPGTYVCFGPNSQHRPRSETGVRLFGFNLAEAVHR